jgi:enoyl-[acyl-carrier protein] reductase III
MDLEFKNKWALITGGTKGLGLSFAKELAGRGCHLILTYRKDHEGAKKSQAQIQEMGKGKCQIIKQDLSEEGGIEALFDEIDKLTPDLHYYIHNAAATAFKNLLEIKGHHIDKTLNITVKGFILGVQRASKLMEKNGGAILGVSGMDTLRAVPKHGLLAAAKSSLETLINYYAHELAPKGIRVNGINPGFFPTESTEIYLGPMFNQVVKGNTSLIPSGKEPSSEIIAKAGMLLLEEKSRWIVGQTLKVDGGADFSIPLLKR